MKVSSITHREPLALLGWIVVAGFRDPGSLVINPADHPDTLGSAEQEQYLGSMIFLHWAARPWMTSTAITRACQSVLHKAMSITPPSSVYTALMRGQVSGNLLEAIFPLR